MKNKSSFSKALRILIYIVLLVLAYFSPDIFGALFYRLFGISLTFIQATVVGLIVILAISGIIYITYNLIKKRIQSK